MFAPLLRDMMCYTDDKFSMAVKARHLSVPSKSTCRIGYLHTYTRLSLLETSVLRDGGFYWLRSPGQAEPEYGANA